jgi:hypothetical protein
MSTTKLLICAISIAAAVAAARSSGQTLTATLAGMTPGLEVTATMNNGASFERYDAGVYDFTAFDAFCVETSQPIDFGETLTYQVQDINLLPNSDTIARLVGGYLASPQTNADAAAVQWAIWEITTETLAAPSLLDGKVRIKVPVSQPTADLANQYLANVSSFTPASLVYLTNPNRQDMVTWNIPEPGALGLVAFSAFLMLRRRR